LTSILGLLVGAGFSLDDQKHFTHTSLQHTMRFSKTYKKKDDPVLPLSLHSTGMTSNELQVIIHLISIAFITTIFSLFINAIIIVIASKALAISPHHPPRAYATRKDKANPKLIIGA
jgi:hypothetical protein